MEHLQKDFLREYNDGENVRRYMRKTAGHGISYLLQHEYNDIYLEAVDKYLLKVKTGKGLRLLEFGCGAWRRYVALITRGRIPPRRRNRSRTGSRWQPGDTFPRHVTIIFLPGCFGIDWLWSAAGC